MKSTQALDRASQWSRRFLILFSILAAAAWPSCLLAQASFIRVHQTGYVSSAAKRAYLMTSSTSTSSSFSVLNSGGSAVFSAALGADQGKWGTFAHVYVLDFDSVSTAGTYTISVSGAIAASSPSFQINSGANLYSTPLANSLYFYENERDGANFIATPLRTAAAHLNDQHGKVYFSPSFNRKDNAGTMTPTGAAIDATGGWWDAGDYLKFVETHSYTVALMLEGVRDFPNQMGGGSSTSNFTAESKFGLDWLQKMWDDNSKTLYYQVGIASGGHAYVGDHDIWRLPQADDTYQNCVSPYEFICNRPVLLNTAGGAGASISPNLAGRLAADFAECYQVFKTSNPTYADQCLLSAEHIFDLANTAPGTLLSAGPFDFYPETEWRDDLELGATELYFALQAGNLPSGLPPTDPMFFLPPPAHLPPPHIPPPHHPPPPPTPPHPPPP